MIYTIIALFLLFVGAVGVAFHFGKLYAQMKEKLVQKDATIELQGRMIFAMKRVTESQKYLHGKLEEISGAKSASHLTEIYNSLITD